jgi:hypothetical protein
MLTLKIKEADSANGASLCYSCNWGHVVRGYRDTDEIVQCMRPYLEIRIPFPVRECSSYKHKNSPSMEDMEKSAWILLTKRIERRLGFIKADEFRRIHGEDEPITP